MGSGEQSCGAVSREEHTYVHTSPRSHCGTGMLGQVDMLLYLLGYACFMASQLFPLCSPVP